jgi:hypothetical protein
MKIAILSLLFSVFFSCGNNTRTPVIPFIFFIPPGVPQISGVIPITDLPLDINLVPDGQSDRIPYKPEFILKYYVTNTEPNFVGYNLTITSAIPSLADTLAGGSVYAENGIQPSFPHLATESSTELSQQKKRRISNRIPPPGLVPFQHCEIYTFTMRAFFNNGVLSNPSASVSACANPFPGKCPIGSSCNPMNCSTSTCSASEKSTCPVGTACNPCLFAGTEGTGCECPVGVSPPGCNP